MVYEAVNSIFIFMHRCKRNIRNLSEREFEKMLYSNDLTYNQKIYLIYFRYI